MDLLQILLLIGGGILGGIISTLVGGAAIVTFPAMIAAGLSPAVAVASNLVAMIPTVVYSAYDDRRRLPRFDRIFVMLIVVVFLGGFAGAILLLLTPSRAFQVVVPLLLGVATALFALGRPLNTWMRERAMRLHGREPEIGAGGIAVLLPVSIYIGYFGAGAGVMLLAIFSIWKAGDYRTANVMKNLVASLNMLSAASIFVLQDIIDWRATAIMMAGGFAGGMVGRPIARIVRQEVMEVVVIATGSVLTAIYVWRYWF